MLRASIFQKNILNSNKFSDFVQSFESNLVHIDSSSLKVYNDEQLLFQSSLTQKDADFHTTTFHGQFEDGTRFRIIRPNEVPLINIKNQYNCVSAFSMASIEQDGYAIHFILTEKNDIRNNSVVEKGKDEQIGRLLEGCILALQSEMYDRVIDFSKRILNIIDNANMLHNYQYGSQILTIMEENLNLFSESERIKILKS